MCPSLLILRQHRVLGGPTSPLGVTRIACPGRPLLAVLWAKRSFPEISRMTPGVGRALPERLVTRTITRTAKLTLRAQLSWIFWVSLLSLLTALLLHSLRLSTTALGTRAILPEYYGANRMVCGGALSLLVPWLLMWT